STRKFLVSMGPSSALAAGLVHDHGRPEIGGTPDSKGSAPNRFAPFRFRSPCRAWPRIRRPSWPPDADVPGGSGIPRSESDRREVASDERLEPATELRDVEVG